MFFSVGVLLLLHVSNLNCGQVSHSCILAGLSDGFTNRSYGIRPANFLLKTKIYPSNPITKRPFLSMETLRYVLLPDHPEQ